MVLQLICTNCGNMITLEPTSRGNTMNIDNEINGHFYIEEIEISLDPYDIEDLDDSDDIERNLNALTIRCNKCKNDYMNISFNVR